VTDRKALARAIATLGPGDVFLVTRLDRLATSTRDLLKVLDAVGKAGAGFKSLADIWADTTTPHGRLMLSVLGGLADYERELIMARTEEGRKRTQAALLRVSTVMVTRPVCERPIARAAAGDRSMCLPRTHGPRSLIRTVAHPLWQTRTRVPNAKVRCAAVSSAQFRRSPLAVGWPHSPSRPP
jgi:Resolvase, N terminal domain